MTRRHEIGAHSQIEGGTAVVRHGDQVKEKKTRRE